MAEKKFFRVRLTDKCSVAKKMVNGIPLTKQWQVKVGEIGDFAKFPDVETQTVVKRGNDFVPAEEASEGDTGGSDSTKVQVPATPENGSGAHPDFNNMTVEQLKSYLIAKGVAQNELRNAAKAELVERAEFIWSQSN